MTRRKSKQPKPPSLREARIAKLMERGWIAHAAEIPVDAIPVDPDLINIGQTFGHLLA